MEAEPLEEIDEEKKYDAVCERLKRLSVLHLLINITMIWVGWLLVSSIVARF